jgi:tRNA(fMet)-specific endonuclease VapC
MNLTYLVETDWAVHWLRGNRLIIDKLSELRQYGLGLSIISLAELYAGIYRSMDILKAKDMLGRFLRRVTILDVSDDICQIFGEENARLRNEGQLIEDFDLMIAATCLYHDLDLLTNNRRHFERIDGLNIISIDR